QRELVSLGEGRRRGHGAERIAGQQRAPDQRPQRPEIRQGRQPVDEADRILHHEGPAQNGRCETELRDRARQLGAQGPQTVPPRGALTDRKSTRLNSSHVSTSYAVFCLKKKNRSAPTPAPSART